MFRVATGFALVLFVACSSSSDSSKRKPAGTPTDPVAVCERIADVCRMDSSRLGVCTAPLAGTKPAVCEGGEPCLICMSQH
jgi:hypothetical protein